MPFELKIVKAMYQRLKDIIFSGKIGWNLKVDIDEHGHQDLVFMLTSWVIEANLIFFPDNHKYEDFNFGEKASTTVWKNCSVIPLHIFWMRQIHPLFHNIEEVRYLSMDERVSVGEDFLRIKKTPWQPPLQFLKKLCNRFQNVPIFF